MTTTDGRHNPLDDLVDASLRRLMEPPAASGFVPAEVFAQSSPSARSALTGSAEWSWRRTGLIAACLAMLAFSGWSLWSYLKPIAPPAETTSLTRLQHYEVLRTAGFPVETPFVDAASLCRHVEGTCGVSVDLAPTPEGIEIRGVTKAGAVSSNALAVIARVNGADIVVYVDRRFQMIGSTLPGGASLEGESASGTPSSGLYEHTIELGGLRIVEVSPLKEALLLDLFRLPL